jgi:membrane protease YdiL (CAAX protease family)
LLDERGSKGLVMAVGTGDTTGWERRLQARPLASVLGLEAFFVVLVVGGSLLLGALVPGLPGYSLTGMSRALVVAALAAVVLLALVGALRWWRFVGFTRPSEWRDLRVYWLPLVLLFAPFVAGVRLLSPSTLALLCSGYLLSIVFEEVLFRGVILGLLRPSGVWRAVLVSSALFGLTHLSNSSLRGFSVLIVLQAVQGIGYAALRLRTNTIWLLIAFHFLHDVTLQMGHLPIALVEAPIDIALAVYGIVLLRGRRSQELPARLSVNRELAAG